MLELHHDTPTPDTLKLRIALAEAGVDYASRPVNVATLAQWRAPYRTMAPGGEVPVLVADGTVMNDATFALEYVAEALAPGRLAPTDPLGWYEVQAWLNKLDPLRASVNLLGWNATTETEERTRYRQELGKVEGRKRLAGWSAVVEDAEVSEDELQVARDRIGELVDKLEAQLAKTEWLAGTDYSIADIAAFSLVHSLPRLTPEIVDETRTPRLFGWIAAIGARPAVVDALGNTGDHYAPPT